MAITSRFAFILVNVTLLLVFFAMSGHSAAVTTMHRRSVRQSNANSVEECRTNAVCGWQIYNASTRVSQRYVPTTCRCNKKDLCRMSEDDIGVPAYVYRCRYSPPRNRSTTQRPSNDTTAGSS